MNDFKLNRLLFNMELQTRGDIPLFYNVRAFCLMLLRSINFYGCGLFVCLLLRSFREFFNDFEINTTTSTMFRNLSLAHSVDCWNLKLETPGSIPAVEYCLFQHFLSSR